MVLRSPKVWAPTDSSDTVSSNPHHPMLSPSRLQLRVAEVGGATQPQGWAPTDSPDTVSSNPHHPMLPPSRLQLRVQRSGALCSSEVGPSSEYTRPCIQQPTPSNIATMYDSMSSFTITSTSRCLRQHCSGHQGGTEHYLTYPIIVSVLRAHEDNTLMGFVMKNILSYVGNLTCLLV